MAIQIGHGILEAADAARAVEVKLLKLLCAVYRTSQLVCLAAGTGYCGQARRSGRALACGTALRGK